MTNEGVDSDRPEALRRLYRDDPLDDLTTDDLDRSNLVRSIRSTLDRIVGEKTSTVLAVVGPGAAVRRHS